MFLLIKLNKKFIHSLTLTFTAALYIYICKYNTGGFTDTSVPRHFVTGPEVC